MKRSEEVTTVVLTQQGCAGPEGRWEKGEKEAGRSPRVQM